MSDTSPSEASKVSSKRSFENQRDPPVRRLSGGARRNKVAPPRLQPPHPQCMLAPRNANEKAL
ncbi:hypothetical protein C5688_04595 [Methylocystis sp. MitZ-2018]|nr:hypothetical protein C5688_04595 [Methylocystis sp. MitZ-2018]